MTELKPWVDSGAPDGVRELFLAAREERPDGGGPERTLVALGVGGVVITGAAHASGAAGAGAAAGAAKSVVAASSAALAVKWGLIGAVSAVVTMGAVHVALTSRAAKPGATQNQPVHASAPNADRTAATPRALTEPAPEMPALPVVPDVAPTPTVRTTLDVAPTKSPLNPSESSSAASARDDSPRMLEEIRAIDRARGALASGDAERCLGAIEEYESAFSERRFQPEALYLRMEAFGKLGDRAGERATASQLLAAFPRAPQSARAKVVLGQTTP